MSRVYNFSAGPAVLPEEVLKEAAAEMLDYKGVEHLLVLSPHFGADGCPQAVSHGPQAAGGKKGPGIFIFIILSRPHLMLPHLGHDDGF